MKTLNRDVAALVLALTACSTGTSETPDAGTGTTASSTSSGGAASSSTGGASSSSAAAGSSSGGTPGSSASGAASGSSAAAASSAAASSSGGCTVCATRVERTESIRLNSTPSLVGVDGTRVAFLGRVGSGGGTLAVVITDGTAGGTVLHDMANWSMGPLAPMGDRLYFCGRPSGGAKSEVHSLPLVSGSTQQETTTPGAAVCGSVVSVPGAVAWVLTEGSAISVTVKTMTSGPTVVSSGIVSHAVAVVGDRFYFTQRPTGASSTAPSNLITVSGTTPTDLGSVPTQLEQVGTGGESPFADVGGELWALFTTTANWEIRRYNATSLVETVLLPRVGNRAPFNFVASPPNMYFDYEIPGGGYEPHVTDGTTAGTRVLIEAPGSAGASQAIANAREKRTATTNGGAYLRLSNMPAYFYRTDGTPNGTTAVDLGTLGPSVVEIASKDGALFFKSDFYASRSTGVGYEAIRTPAGLRIQSTGLWAGAGRIWFTGRAEGSATDSIYFVE